MSQAATQSARKPSLPALTAVRAFTAVNILLFHFSDPKTFGPFAPIVDGGFVAVSFFFLLSGYIMAYNYADKAESGVLSNTEFWWNRIARLYPVFFLSLLISWQMLRMEWHAQSHGMFAAGVILTPLMLQAWHPVLATFWSTPAWALSVEIFLYAVFPFLIRKRLPSKPKRVFAMWWMVWALGLIGPILYVWIKPDGPVAPDRFAAGWWLRALKFLPLQHLPTFCCGILLARLQSVWHVTARWRITMAFAGFACVFALLTFGYVTGERFWTYPFLHDPMMVPFYACIIFGLSADHWLTWLIARPAFVIVGEASYCLYILHFNLWQILHDDGLLVKLHLVRYDPWISYAIILMVAVLVYRYVERPAQRWLRSWHRRPAPSPAILTVTPRPQQSPAA